MNPRMRRMLEIISGHAVIVLSVGLVFGINAWIGRWLFGPLGPALVVDWLAYGISGVWLEAMALGYLFSVWSKAGDHSAEAHDRPYREQP